VTASVLISGSIFRTPEQKVSASGKKYVKATIKVSSRDESESEFWSVMTFSESCGEELLRLTDGDHVAIQGGLKLGQYEKDGQARVSRTVFANSVLPLRSAPKQRRTKTSAPKRDSDFGTCGLKPINIMPDGDEPEGRFFSDSIPF